MTKEYQYELIPFQEEFSLDKPKCAICRIIHKDGKTLVVCPNCFGFCWIPFSSLILCFNLNISSEMLDNEQISMFVKDYLRANNLHLGINRKCVRSLNKLIPAIPMEFSFDFLLKFNNLFLKNHDFSYQKELITQQFYEKVYILAKRFPVEVLVMPFRIAQFALNYKPNVLVDVEKERFLNAFKQSFFFNFDHGFGNEKENLAQKGSKALQPVLPSQQKHLNVLPSTRHANPLPLQPGAAASTVQVNHPEKRKAIAQGQKERYELYLYQ